MAVFIDMHHHILYGIDDGPTNLKTAQKMADAAEAEGIGIIIATPHQRPGVRPFDFERYRATLGELNRYCMQKRYALRILAGAEIMYTESTVRLLQAGAVPTLNGTRYILVEWSASSTAAAIERSIRKLNNAGYIVVMAHVERFPCLYKRGILETLRENYDVRVQVDCDAVAGVSTLQSRWFVRRLLRKRLVDYIATDAHDLKKRPVRMAAAYAWTKAHCGVNYAKSVSAENQKELLIRDAKDEPVAGKDKKHNAPPNPFSKEGF